MADYQSPTAPSKLPTFPAPMPAGGLYAPPTADQIKLRQYMAGPGTQRTGPSSNPDQESAAASMPLPKAADTAAADAVAKGLGAQGPIGDSQEPTRPAASASDANNATAANDAVKQMLAGIMPDKAAGEAAMMNPGGGAKALNYGTGMPIIASGRAGKDALGMQTEGKANSFSGAGGLPIGQPAGAAGVTPQSAFAQMHGYLTNVMQQAAAARQRGDGLAAKGLELHAQRFSTMYQTLAQHEYQQGALGLQGQQLDWQKTREAPAVRMETQKANAAESGDLELTDLLTRAFGGNPLFPQSVVPIGSYTYDANTKNAPLQLRVPDLKK